MRNGLIRLNLVTVAIAAGLFLLPRSAAAQCGNCDPGSIPAADHAETGNYKFAAGISEDFQQTTFWADDGWGMFGHEPNDPNAITIETVSVPASGVTAIWDPDAHNGRGAIIVNVGHSLLANCNDNCNALQSIIAHEMGHAAGLADITGGCETSIMSHARDRNYVLGPSSEDLCWFWMQGEGGGGEEGGCQPYCLDVIPNSETRSLPVGWKRIIAGSSLAVVLNLTSVVQEDQETQLAAYVAKIVGGIRAHSVGSVADVDLGRSMFQLAKITTFSDLTVGSAYLAFLTWDQQTQSFALSRRPVLLRR